MTVLWRGFALLIRIVAAMCLLLVVMALAQVRLPIRQRQQLSTDQLIDQALQRQQRWHDCKKRCEPLQYPLYWLPDGKWVVWHHELLLFPNVQDLCKSCP